MISIFLWYLSFYEISLCMIFTLSWIQIPLIRCFDHNAPHFPPGVEDNKENIEVGGDIRLRISHWKLNIEMGGDIRSHWKCVRGRNFWNWTNIDSDITWGGKRLKFSWIEIDWRSIKLIGGETFIDRVKLTSAEALVFNSANDSKSFGQI